MVEDPLGPGVEDLGVLVGAGHPPWVQGAVDHSDPYYSLQQEVSEAGFLLLLDMAVEVVGVAPGASSPAGQPLDHPGPQ